jgi:lipoprotein NlpI
LGSWGLLAWSTALAFGLLLPSSTRADASHDACVSAYDSQDWDGVLDHCDRAIRSGQLTDSDMVDALMRRCWARKEKGEPEQALEDCDEALRRDPNHPVAYNVRGSVYRRMGQPDRAIEDYDQALRLNPDFPFAYNNRGNAYDTKGDYQRALADYNEALRLNPDYAMAYNNRGDTYEGMGDYARAIEDYTQALRLNPDLAMAYNNRGNVHFYLGSFAQAAQDIEAAVERGFGGPYPFLWLFLARERAGLDGVKTLEALAPEPDMDLWPGPIIGYFQGKVSKAKLQGMVERSGPKLKARKTCEYNYYVGEAELLEDQVASARAMLEQAVASCEPTDIEFHGAKAELARQPQ